MAEKNPTETDGQVPTRPHDSGGQANETADGLDSETEALRRAAEGITAPEDAEKVPVFDRADLPPKI
jgi:hypothetical protein